MTKAAERQEAQIQIGDEVEVILKLGASGEKWTAASGCVLKVQEANCWNVLVVFPGIFETAGGYLARRRSRYQAEYWCWCSAEDVRVVAARSDRAPANVKG